MSGPVVPRLAGSAPRIEVIDAIRGFALLGILQVNIQSFVWGAGNPLGYLDDGASRTDQMVFLILAILASSKFYAIFALLFGAGFALQIRKMRRLAGGKRPVALAMYRRRIAFLMGAGIVHGTLLYFGDILTSYALCALVLPLVAWLRPAVLLRRARLACIFAAAVLVFWTVVDTMDAAGPDAVQLPDAQHVEVRRPAARAIRVAEMRQPEGGGEDADDSAIPADRREAYEVYVHEGYRAQLATRIDDYLDLTLGGVYEAWAQIVALFLLGTLAGRLGWLRHPQRHVAVWRGAWRIGLGIGLPAAVLGGFLHLQAIRDDPDGAFGLDELVLSISTLLSLAYIAAFVRWRDVPAMRKVQRWLEPAGRMPLTNYVAQSCAMGALLSGWGLALAPRLTRIDLAAVALLIYAAQLAASRAWLAHHAVGPLEALWRRATYGR